MSHLAALILLAATASDARPVPFVVRNPTMRARREIVRVSLPIPRGALSGGLPQAVTLDGKRVPAQATIITRHPDRSARRVMVSFAVELGPACSAEGRYGPAAEQPAARPALFEGGRLRTAAYALVLDGDRLRALDRGGRELAGVRAFGPAPAKARPAESEVIENGPEFAWIRWRQQGDDFAREVDVQVDALGRAKLVARLQSRLGANAWTPDFGFELAAQGASLASGSKPTVHFLGLEPRSKLADHPELAVGLKLTDGTAVAVANPLALRQHRGTLAVGQALGKVTLRAGRLEPVADENNKLMIQDGQWRVLELVLRPGTGPELAEALDGPLAAHADWRAYDAVYHTGPPLEVKSPVLRAVAERYVGLIERMSIDGDDWGNMTSYSPTTGQAAINSMVRYNHCQYVWEDYFRTGDPRLLAIARDWSENYRNLSVYWGHEAKYYGGSRRGRAYRDDPKKGAGPGTYMVRFDYAQCYVTKGYHNFWLAYEETADPRFKEAAEAQARWSAENVHADRGEMRNVGMITDYAKLYGYTGERFYLEQAQRLWREFQTKQMPDLMFTQGGKPAKGNELYIFDDAYGYKHPFYKAYITQYASNSLPNLLEWCPGDARLRATILAANDWMARVQTEGGGWGYPGPTSAGMNWSIEYCHGLALACALEPKPAYLDAIQRTLRTIVGLYKQWGEVSSGLAPWEPRLGITITSDTYRLGTDRDRSKDYTHGAVKFDASPDGTVYFPSLLRDYLRHRSEDSLFTTDPTLDAIRRLPAVDGRPAKPS